MCICLHTNAIHSPSTRSEREIDDETRVEGGVEGEKVVVVVAIARQIKVAPLGR